MGKLATNLAVNSGGRDKYYQFRPNCTYLGSKIPTFVSCNENRLITSEILASAMKHLDDHATINCSEATPFLLLNGHGSHFGLKCLSYMNDPATKWTVCIGVPYGTNLWQVGDSAQQNGAFKMVLKKVKQHIING